MSTREYAVVIEEEDGAWGAWVPELPGCTTAGDSYEEALAGIREAIELYVETLSEHGEPAPHGDRVELVRATAVS